MTDANVPSREELERRIVDLEVRAAFQAQTMELLDGVVREFATRVEALERALVEVRGQVAAGWPARDADDLLGSGDPEYVDPDKST